MCVTQGRTDAKLVLLVAKEEARAEAQDKDTRFGKSRGKDMDRDKNKNKRQGKAKGWAEAKRNPRVIRSCKLFETTGEHQTTTDWTVRTTTVAYENIDRLIAGC